MAYGELVIKSDQVGTLCRVLVDPVHFEEAMEKCSAKTNDFAQN